MTIDETRAQGAANNTAGKVQDAIGALTGDLRTQAEGKLRQVQGKAQEAYGRVSERAEVAGSQADEFIRNKPYEAVAIAAGVGLILGLLIRR
ncbi:MAG TPA: CsbD family protein [Phenylobacterium sp.]